MKRLAWYAAALLLASQVAGVVAYRAMPEVFNPILRPGYVWLWEQSKTWGLDPCRSCPIPDRFTQPRDKP